MNSGYYRTRQIFTKDKIVLSNSSKYMQLVIDRDKWINHVINLEGKLKYYLKVLKTDDKISEKEFDSAYPVRTTTGI